MALKLLCCLEALSSQMFLGCFFPREYVVVVVVIIPDDPMHEQIM